MSRALSDMDVRGAPRMWALARGMALERRRELSPPRVTVGFDGTVLATSRLAEGTAVGCNPAKRGQRSCWPLSATVAQTGQALDVLDRPGNVADSAGALASSAKRRTGCAVPSKRYYASGAGQLSTMWSTHPRLREGW